MYNDSTNITCKYQVVLFNPYEIIPQLVATNNKPGWSSIIKYTRRYLDTCSSRGLITYINMLINTWR